MMTGGRYHSVAIATARQRAPIASAMSSGDKILIVGPAKAGKTAIANFLAKYPDAERAASPSQSYIPTVGTRFVAQRRHALSQ